MANFDPYHQWLGIPPSEQPPDHYRLLGIRQLEDDPSVIENAADRQMAHLKTFQAGPSSNDSQRLLNQVAAARVCLLNAAKKDAYDQQLCQAVPQGGHAEQEIKLNTAAPRGRKGLRKSSRKGNWGMVAALGGIMIVAFAVIVTLVITGRNKSPAPEETVSVAAMDHDAQAAGEPSAPQSSNDASKPVKIADFPPGSIITQSAGSESKTRHNATTDSKNDLIIEQPEPPADHVGMAEDWMMQGKDDAGDDTSDPSESPEAEEKPAEEKPAAEKPAAEPKVKQKLPVPSASQQKAIAKRMEEAYDFSGAKTPGGQRQLARQLLRDGQASRGSDGEAFVLLSRSAELSVIGGDAALMFRAIDAISDRYEVDAAELNLKLLKRFVAAAKTPANLLAFRQACQERIDGYLAAGRYQAALDTIKVVCQSVQRVRNKDFRKQMLTWQQSLSKLQKDHLAFEQAKRKLAEAPENANAALVVGRWYCFGQEDFAQGLPFLAKGSDSALATVAKSELKFVSKGQSHTAGDAVDLGNVWWEMAEKAKGAEAVHYRLRALHWYAQAKPRLSGLEKATVNKRLDSFIQLAYRSYSNKSLAGLLSQIDVGKSGSGRTQKRQPIKWKARVRCDDSFEMCVNGKRVMAGNNRDQLYQSTIEMAPGDIITVRVDTLGEARGFSCVIRSERGHILVSGPAWRIFEPKDPNDWANPVKADVKSRPSASPALVAGKLSKDTGIKVKGIWGHRNPSYLMLKVQ